LEGWQAERLKGSKGISLTENVLVSFKWVYSLVSFYRDITKIGISSFNISELRRVSINFRGIFYLFPWHWDVKHLSMM
jgi:hypothetical protein